MPSTFVETMTIQFVDVTDPLANRGRNFPLIEMIFIALCGAICDFNTWVDVSKFGNTRLAWLRKFMPFEFGIPSP